MEDIVKYVNYIYFGKYIAWHLSDRGINNFINIKNNDMWYIYVDFYQHISSFKINPKFKNNTDVKEIFKLYIEERKKLLIEHINDININIIKNVVYPNILDKDYIYKK